ncbi:hypothetical protein P3102_19345 [Amycolatopsis sp. QT-25]|uniref:hypothetical protein n=1 Tax=Amycolatopsis sp. QT-25 TaxID=3034022 RepID=UPI0023EA9EA6|nr:hypothetical protein [Amycolatopsis sp. QT-25]WET76290.1 hypothetical protein P3102_19345 [Amycolatopsis sp. QT-25]
MNVADGARKRIKHRDFVVVHQKITNRRVLSVMYVLALPMASVMAMTKLTRQLIMVWSWSATV